MVGLNRGNELSPGVAGGPKWRWPGGRAERHAHTTLLLSQEPALLVLTHCHPTDLPDCSRKSGGHDAMEPRIGTDRGHDRCMTALAGWSGVTVLVISTVVHNGNTPDEALHEQIRVIL